MRSPGQTTRDCGRAGAASASRRHVASSTGQPTSAAPRCPRSTAVPQNPPGSDCRACAVPPLHTAPAGSASPALPARGAAPHPPSQPHTHLPRSECRSGPQTRYSGSGDVRRNGSDVDLPHTIKPLQSLECRRRPPSDF